jgi:outer membrane protein OmpA-like peptidoglycan-associated protein
MGRIRNAALLLPMICLVGISCAKDPAPEPVVTPQTRFVLFPEADGGAGALMVKNRHGSRLLTQPYETIEVMDADTAPSAPKKIDVETVRELFGDAAAAEPSPPVVFILYFQGGTAELTGESAAKIPDIIAAIEDRKAVDIGITGHSDRKGDVEYNLTLSLKRAEAVAESLYERGVDPDIVKVSSHGEENPLIETPDDVAEPRNRRVEVTVR